MKFKDRPQGSLEVTTAWQVVTTSCHGYFDLDFLINSSNNICSALIFSLVRKGEGESLTSVKKSFQTAKAKCLEISWGGKGIALAARKGARIQITHSFVPLCSTKESFPISTRHLSLPAKRQHSTHAATDSTEHRQPMDPLPQDLQYQIQFVVCF